MEHWVAACVSAILVAAWIMAGMFRWVNSVSDSLSVAMVGVSHYLKFVKI